MVDECNTSADVRQALLGRWPPSEYVSINEAPQSSDRQGRKLDVLVVSLWRSRGHELDGVEIKVSVSDWRRELKEAAKADWWWSHIHRFWIAVPASIAPKVKDELPSGWGLLSCAPQRVSELIKPVKHTPEALPWGACIGLLRASADTGLNALQHAEAKGRMIGREQAERELARSTGDERLRRQLAELTEKVEKFEQASGIDLAKCWDVDGLGESVALVQKIISSPTRFSQRLERQAEDTEAIAVKLRELATSLLENPVAQPPREA
jgi:hypothetical protein